MSRLKSGLKSVKELDPIRFIFDSLDFMEGCPKIEVWTYMPIAYYKYCHQVFKYIFTGRI